MVREIIHLQVGQCGNQIGNVFWESICKDHQLSESGSLISDPETSKNKLRLQTEKMSVYFAESSDNKYVPRAIMLDTDPGPLEVVKAGRIGKMFNPDNYVAGASSVLGGYGRSYLTESSQIIEEYTEVLQKELEVKSQKKKKRVKTEKKRKGGEVQLCDSPQGFQVMHSLGGSTGSGLGTLLLEHLRNNYPTLVTSSFSVLPSQLIVETYHAILGLSQLIDHSHATFTIDNASLFNICKRTLKSSNPTYKDLNWITSLAMNGVTSSFRRVQNNNTKEEISLSQKKKKKKINYFYIVIAGDYRIPCKLNDDLHKMRLNLIPFPRLHFLLMSHYPFFKVDESKKVDTSVSTMTDYLWSSVSSLANIVPGDGKYLSDSFVIRGENVSMNIWDVFNMSSHMAEDFVNFIPNLIKITVIPLAPTYTPLNGTLLCNTTCIKNTFAALSSTFSQLFQRKTMLHRFTREGIDELQFSESHANVQSLISEYQDKQDVVVDLENELDAVDEENSIEQNNESDFYE
ncbi:beta-tubulin [Reticulomyxa filosa]|uniref:Beta-tubulin n=1 Tax=Reticulomyxa filosa TaxID=46433 RepID=X6NTJ0_RETFI|nr:beta-tubulin [Reticulomyxa filosa]|eukprot:ETO29268.1 beta-tubulin [Reticulomyxa filosa]